jgi:hypothetical protein
MKNRFIRAQQIARAAADKYFAALVADIPGDETPGGATHLIDAAINIESELIATRKQLDAQSDHDVEREAALHAGYLLGVEIGRRIRP